MSSQLRYKKAKIFGDNKIKKLEFYTSSILSRGAIKVQCLSGFLYVKPIYIDEEILKIFGLTKEKNSDRYKMPARIQDVELLQNLGINIEYSDDNFTNNWLKTAQKQDQLDQYLQQAFTINKKVDNKSWNKFFPHQKVGTSFIATRKRALLSFTPGLGKSNTSITASTLLKHKKILIVCPQTLFGTWRNEILIWSDDTDIAIEKKDFINLKNKWTITNPESVVSLVNSVNWNDALKNLDYDLIIVDESILYKNHKSIRSKALVKFCESIEYVWLLSGSPVKKYADDLYSQLHILFPKVFKSYWRFAAQWCHIQQTPWASIVVGNKSPEALRHYLRDIMLSRTPDEAFDEEKMPEFKFPDLLLEPIYLDVSKKQDELISIASTKAEIEQHTGEKLKITAAISLLTRISQIVSSPYSVGILEDSNKTLAALDMIETIELPAIIWFQFTKSLKRFEYLAKLKNYRVGTIYGDIKNSQRQKTIDEYQNGKLDLILIELDTGKFGLSLTATKTVIYHDRSFDIDVWVQSTHRVRRLSSRWEATGYVLHGGYTDYLIDKIIREKITSLSQLSLTDIFNETIKTTSRIDNMKK